MEDMIRPWRLVAIAALALAAAVACPKPVADSPTTGTEDEATSKPDEATSQPTAVAPDGVAATVNGVELSNAKVAQAMAQIAASSGVPPHMLSPGMKSRLQSVAMESVISRELLRQHVKSLGITVEQADAEKKYAEMVAALPPGKTEADIQSLLGVGPAELKEELKTDLGIDTIVEKYRTEAKPDAAAARTHYNGNKEKYTTPEQLSASHILLRIPEGAPPQKVQEIEAKAKELANKARKTDAAGFAALADAQSEDPSVSMNHGDMGFFEAGRMVTEFSEAAKKLKKGETSAPVRTQFGFHIIRGQGQRKAGLQPFASVREEIEKELTETGIRDRMKELVDGLKAKAKIEQTAPPPAPAPPATPPSMPPPMPPPISAPTPAPSPAPAPAPAPAPTP